MGLMPSVKTPVVTLDPVALHQAITNKLKEQQKH